MKQDFKRMRQHRQPAQFMNRGGGFCQRQTRFHRLCDPQRQHMTIAAADFQPRDNLKRIAGTMFIGPQAGIQRIMIGNGDHVQTAPRRHIIQKLADGGAAIAGGGVHMNIGLSKCFFHWFGPPITTNDFGLLIFKQQHSIQNKA